MKIGQEVKELKKRLKEAKIEEKRQAKEERAFQIEQRKAEKIQLKEESRFRKEQKKEERNLQKKLSEEKDKSKSKQRPAESKNGSSRKQKDKEINRDYLPMTWAASYLPIQKIKNGIIYTTDNRYVKIVEILPINFLLRSPSEQRNIIFSFLSYLKIAPIKIQFKVVSKKADIAEYLSKIQEEIEKEEDEQCRILQEDYANLIRSIGTKEAITRRFFLIFEFYSYNGNRNPKESEVFLYMKTAVQTTKKYLAMCGNAILEYENESRFCVELFYQLLNRRTSVTEPFSERIEKVKQWISDQRIIEATKQAGIYEFITSLPRGFNTEVGENGIKLSGGQKQRIAIARILLKNTPIVILDEATASLDNNLEDYIVDKFYQVLRGRTVIVISHRLSIIKNCSNINIIKHGEIVESGKHEYLISIDGEYKKLYDKVV